MLLTLFDAGNPKYGIKTHMGLDISGYDNYRSIHIAEARDVPNPSHVQCLMYGGVNYFEEL